MRKLKDFLDEISKYRNEIYCAEQKLKEIEEEKQNFVNKHKKFIAEKVFENFTEKEKNNVYELRKQVEQSKVKFDENILDASLEEKTMLTIPTGYFQTSVFDPLNDWFEVTNYKLNEDKTKVKFTVECMKNRYYWSMSGSFCPCLYDTVWIDLNENIPEDNMFGTIFDNIKFNN